MMVFSEFHSTFIVGDGKRGKTRKTLPMKKWEVWVFPAFAATGIHAVVSHAVGGWTVEERSQTGSIWFKSVVGQKFHYSVLIKNTLMTA